MTPAELAALVAFFLGVGAAALGVVVAYQFIESL